MEVEVEAEEEDSEAEQPQQEVQLPPSVLPQPVSQGEEEGGQKEEALSFRQKNMLEVFLCHELLL